MALKINFCAYINLKKDFVSCIYLVAASATLYAETIRASVRAIAINAIVIILSTPFLFCFYFKLKTCWF